QARRAHRGVPDQERAVQEARGPDERPRPGREELPQAEGAAHARQREVRGVSVSGFTLIELLFASTLLVTMGGIAVPPLVRALDDYRAIGGARAIAAALQRARMEAVHRSAEVAVRFTATEHGYQFAAYADGNGNGVLSRDIAAGIDQPLG